MITSRDVLIVALSISGDTIGCKHLQVEVTVSASGHWHVRHSITHGDDSYSVGDNSPSMLITDMQP